MDKEMENKEEELEEEELEEEVAKENEATEEVEEETREEEVETSSKIEMELEETKNQLVRLSADFANYKKRNEKERAGLVSFGKESIAEDLLPVLDNFERAMETEADKDSSFYEGIKMIQEQLLEVLNKNDIVEIEAEGQPFDPNYHYAVMMEDSDEHKEGTVIGVLQKGYILKEKVIRPAMVRVAQ